MIFARKIPELYIKIARKIFSRILGGTCPPTPVSYAYGHWLIVTRAGTKTKSEFDFCNLTAAL